MSSFLHDYYFVGLSAAAGALIGFAGLFAGRFVRPKSRVQDDNQVYESGADPVESTAWQQPNIRYYLIALLFLIFDVEIAFVIPWAVQAEGFGNFGLIEIGVFVLVLLLGLVYAWRKGDLEWR